MNVALSQAGEAGVQGGVVDAAGWVILLGGFVLTVLWLRYLYR
jgi:hypothetical protein